MTPQSFVLEEMLKDIVNTLGLLFDRYQEILKSGDRILDQGLVFYHRLFFDQCAEVSASLNHP